MTPLRREFSNSRDRNFKPPVFRHIRAAAHIRHGVKEIRDTGGEQGQSSTI